MWQFKHYRIVIMYSVHEYSICTLPSFSVIVIWSYRIWCHVCVCIILEKYAWSSYGSLDFFNVPWAKIICCAQFSRWYPNNHHIYNTHKKKFSTTFITEIFKVSLYQILLFMFFYKHGIKKNFLQCPCTYLFYTNFENLNTQESISLFHLISHAIFIQNSISLLYLKKCISGNTI